MCYWIFLAISYRVLELKSVLSEWDYEFTVTIPCCYLITVNQTPACTFQLYYYVKQSVYLSLSNYEVCEIIDFN